MLSAFIIRAMSLVSTSETSVIYQTTRRNIPEGCHLHARRRENLKSQGLCSMEFYPHNIPAILSSDLKIQVAGSLDTFIR
jgi:hypothetical protein